MSLFQIQTSRRLGNINCPCHSDSPTILFCEVCKISACNACAKTKHRDHEAVSLDKRIQNVEHDLDAILFKCKQQEEEISRRTAMLNQCKRDIDNWASEVTDEMRRRQELLVQTTQDVLKEQVGIVNEWKENELKTFEKEITDLENLDKCQKDIAKYGGSLLMDPTSPGFISQSNAFLTSSKLADLPPPPVTSWNRILYHQPSQWQNLDSPYFRNYMQEHLLGSFSQDGPVIEVSEQAKLELSFHEDSEASTQSLYSTLPASVSSITDFPIVNRSRPLHGIDELPSIGQKQRAVFLTSMFVKIFEGSHWKAFSSVLFMGNSMWISGRKSSMLLKREYVFVNVTLPDFAVLSKHKKRDSNTKTPIILFSVGDYIFFAKKNGNEVYSFHTHSHTCKQKLKSDRFSIAAMCDDDNHVFILNHNDPKFITVLDANLQPEGKISTHITDTEEVKHCSFDMCLVKSNLSDFEQSITILHTVVISSSAPNGYVRAVNYRHGVLWQLDNTSSKFGLYFDPCSVSCSESGDIYFADQRTDTVCFVSIAFIAKCISKY